MTAKNVAAFVRSKRYDLEKVIGNHYNAKMRFFVSAPDKSGIRDDVQDIYFPKGCSPPLLPGEATAPEIILSTIELFHDISVAVDAMASSYLAPAMHLNNYLSWVAKDIEWDDVKFECDNSIEQTSGLLRRLSIQACSHAVLLGIKSGLDRLVRILTFYYPGIGSHTTWGHYDKKGKPSGFMAITERGRLEDNLLAQIHNAYHNWIRSAVAPRDLLVHYQDTSSIHHFDSEEQVLIQTQVIEGPDGNGHGFGIMTLSEYVKEWYLLADQTLLVLSTRLPRKLKQSRNQRPVESLVVTAEQTG